MGVDGVEFVMAVEEAFQVAIPDEDAQQMLTPRDVVTYVYGRVGSEQGHGCAEQRAFYRLRHASMKVFAQPREAIRPATRWDDILPRRQRPHNWRVLHHATGTPHWPRLTVRGRMPDTVATVGGTARYLVAHGEAVFQRPMEGWSRPAIEAAIERIM